MDVSTFYALFSTSCFVLVGLWWGVIQRDTAWVADPRRRNAVAGVYLAFLLPALMGLFAQVGGTEDPAIWRTSFVVIAIVGGLATGRLLTDRTGLGVTAMRSGTIVAYAAIALLAAFPGIAGSVGLRAIQAEALMLIVLVAMGHALVWWFLTEQTSDR